MKWYFITILVAVIGVTHVNASCRQCNGYGIACISETQFHLCVDGGSPGIADDRMDESVTYTCPAGNICTGLSVKCAPTATSTAVADCQDECDVCAIGKGFACTSKTTFALCSNNEITNIGGTCPDTLLCDTSGNSLCIQKCDVNTITCNRDAPGTGTTTPSTTSSSSSSSSSSTTTTTTTTPAPAQTAAQVCTARNTAGRFPYDNDNACINYVYCRYSGSTLVAVANTCPVNTFFNRNTQNCESVKPSWCV